MEQKKTAVTEYIQELKDLLNDTYLNSDAKGAISTCIDHAIHKLSKEREQMEDMFIKGYNTSETLTNSNKVSSIVFDQNYTQQHGTETK